MLSSEFQSPCIIIEDSKLTLLILLTLSTLKGGGNKSLKPINKNVLQYPQDVKF